MFVAAFDASGHERDQLCLVVAGFISSAKDWSSFDQEWKSRLSCDGISYFHMVEFAHCVKQFKGWKGQEKRRMRLLGDLLEIIRRNVYRKFGAVVVNTTFKENLSDKAKEKFFLNAYSLAGRSCVADVGNWAKEQVPRITTPIQYIFEDGDIGKGKLIERMNRDGYPTPDFRKKKDTIAPDGITLPAFTPLQAADFLAYEIFSSVKKTETTGSSDDLRWAMEEFIKTPIGHPGIYEVEDLERMDMMIKVSQEVERLARLLGIPEKPGPE
jgi:hypothetical protein